MLTLITGGARSGKSRFALEAAAQARKPALIATCEPIDDEMRERIRRHQAERQGRFLTVEEPIDLAAALRSIPGEVDIAIVDCLTVWLGNLLHRQSGGAPSTEPEDFAEVVAFLTALERPPCPLVLVTNEVGLGVVPDNALARSFLDLAGRLNQKVAQRAQRVVLMVSGLPLALKEAQVD